MGVYDDLNAEVQQQEVDDERQRRTTATTTASRSQAQRVSSIRSEYPWLTPGAAASLAKQGHDAKSKATREVARRAAERKKKKGFGWHSIGDMVGGAADWVTPEPVEKVIDFHVRGAKAAPTVGKAVTRGVFTGLQAGQEQIASTFRYLVKQSQFDPKDENGQPALKSEDTGMNPLGASTSAGIALTKLAKGERVDLGSGFLPGGEVAEEQRVAARAELSLPGPNGPGSRMAVTPGRLLAYTVTEPGTREFNWTSGLVDAAFVLSTDPSNLALGQLGKIRQGRKLIDPSVAGGIGLATRRGNIPELANAYLDSANGRKVVGWLAKEQSPYKIYRAMGEKISAEEAAELAGFADETAIVDYIRPKLGTSIRAKPYLANPLTRAVKPVDGFSSYLPESVTKRIDGVRLLHVMPGRHVDPHNSTDVAVNMARAAHNAKLGAEKAEEYFNLAARARGPIGRFDAVNQVQGDIAASLLGGNAGPKVKAGLTRMYKNYVEEATKYNTDEIGFNVPVLGATLRGQEYALPTPHLYSEYINRTIPLPDARAIRRATSKYGRLLDHATLEGRNRPVPVALLDFVFQDAWKPLQLIRGAWTVRVVGEEQIRMAAMGQKSIINHPLQAIAWAVGRQVEPTGVKGRAARKMIDVVPGLTRGRGEIDMTGGVFDPVEDVTDFAMALTRRGDPWRDRVMRMGQVSVGRGSTGYGKAGGRELAKLHADPITRRLVAGLGDGDGVAVRTGNPLVDVKEWFWSGAGQKFRKEMSEAKGRELLATNRGVADELIDSMMARVQTKTAGRPDLAEAVATGSVGGRPVFTKGRNGFDVAADFEAHLDDLGVQGIGPRTFVGDVERRSRGGASSDIGLDHAVDHLFNFFMSRPTNFLSRSPAFRQFYWQRAEELIPAMDQAAQSQLLAAARKANLQPKVLRRMEKAVANPRLRGQLDLDDADTYAKAYGLDETKRLLYDLTERSQLFDITRHIFPFGEAWGEVLKVWARIGTERPQTIRKAQLAINGARGSGFFTTDETTGEEMFNYYGSEFVAGLDTPFTPGIPVRLEGRVQGLNIFSNNPLIPGFGPMVQVPASYFLPRKSSWNTVRNMVLPFGEETLEGGALEAFLPAWLRKLRQANKTPFGVEDQRLWNNTYFEAHRYLRNKHSDWSTEKLDAEATSSANRLYVLRAAAQFFAPSAPTPKFMAEDKAGRLVVANKLVEEYHRLVAADRRNNTDTAVEIFLNTYGPDALEYMQGKSEGGGPMSSKALDWINDNAKFVKKYPLTYALFAPQDEGFNYDAYVQLIQNGTIKPIENRREFAELANNRVAAMIYRQAQEAVEEADADEAADWLAEIKEELRVKYPGYDTRTPDTKRTPNMIREISAAVDEPAVRDLPVARGIRAYLGFREEALAEVRDRGEARHFNKAKSTEDIRQWLREQGAELSKRYRGFDEVFTRLFANELRPQEDD